MKDNNFHISSAKLSGNPSASGWTQVHEFVPTEKEKLEKRGSLYAIISVSLGSSPDQAEQGFDSVASGREILARLHEEYFGKLQTTAFSALKDAVSTVVKEFSESLGQVEIAAISVKEGIIYSAAGGGAQVSLFRQGMIAKILDSKPGSTISASGRADENDVLLLTTSLFFNYFTEGTVKASLQEKDISKAMEAFAPVIHTKKDSFKLGLVLIKFGALTKFATINEKKKKEKKDRDGVAQVSRGVRSSLGEILKKIRSRSPEKKLFIKGVKGAPDSRGFEPGRRKTAVSTGTILISLLIISIVFGIIQKRNQDYKAQFSPQLSQAKHEYEESINLFSLNPERSRELFINSRGIVVNLLAQGYEDEGLIQLKSDIEANLGKILGEYRVDPELFLDLSLLSDGFKGKQMVASEDVIFVLGAEGKRIVSIEIASKKTEVVAGPEDLDEVAALAAYSERVFVEDTDLFEVDDGLTKIIKKDWEDNFEFLAYAGNIYVLDKDESEVYRFAGTGEKFGSKKDWLAPGIDIDFSGVVDWSINGSIWFLFGSGKIYKLTHGSPQAFEVKGVNPHLSQPSLIYTNEELDGVYVLEQGRGRIVALDKEGNYLAQYSSEIIKQVSSMVVSESQEKIILLLADKLQEIEIRH